MDQNRKITITFLPGEKTVSFINSISNIAKDLGIQIDISLNIVFSNSIFSDISYPNPDPNEYMPSSKEDLPQNPISTDVSFLSPTNDGIFEDISNTNQCPQNIGSDIEYDFDYWSLDT